MPAWKCSEEDEADESKDNRNDTVMESILASTSGIDPDGKVGHLHEIWKDYAVLERAGYPDEVQWILIDTDLAGETAGIVAAQEGATVRIDTDAKVSHSDF